jgi:membrane associated rhomboid family serine protease
MGLADRYYMRDEYHPPRITTKLIIVLIGAFVVQSALEFYGDINLYKSLALSVHGIMSGKIWQLLTFQFLHSGPWPWHVLANCLGLYFFGRPVEEMLGGKKFLALYFLTGTAGGILQFLVTLLPRHPDFPVVGASAGVCGMIAIFCSFQPMQELRLWFYFFPISVRARYFLIFLTLISLYGAFIPFDGVAHAAHLGGILLGISYVRWRYEFWEKAFNRIPLLRDDYQRPSIGSLAKRSPWRRIQSAHKSPDTFISSEIDPILDKISAHGLDSLTEAERNLLDKARKKMR